MLRPKSKIKKESHQTNNVLSLPENNWKMAVPYPTTTSRRNPTRPTTSYLCRKATGRWPYLIRLQHPERIDTPPCTSSSWWYANFCQNSDG